MRLYFNCNNSPINSSELEHQIDKLSCYSQSRVAIVSFDFYDCLLNEENLKKLMSTISQKIFDCTDQIIDYLSSGHPINAEINIINIKNSSSIGLNGTRFIIEAAHGFVKFFSMFSTYPMKFTVHLKNNNVLKEKVDLLLESCSNIKVFHHLSGYSVNLVDSGFFFWKAPFPNYTRDPNNFFVAVSNEGVNNSECIFNSPTLGSDALTSVNQDQIASINPLALLSLIIGSVAGIFLLVQSLYSKCFISNNESGANDLDNEGQLESTELPFLGTQLEEADLR